MAHESAPSCLPATLDGHAQRRASCAQFASGTAIGSHIAPLGLSLHDNGGTVLIAERGAWGGPPVGHLVSRINPDFTGHAPLISGFVNTTSRRSWGRPVDVQRMARDDAILVSDDKGNAVYRFVRAPGAASL